MKKRQLALSLGVIVGGTFLYQASAEASASTVQVKAGDTLWSLSTKYHTTVEALKSVNKLSSNTIHIGQTLSIPSASTSQPSNKEESFQLLLLVQPIKFKAAIPFGKLLLVLI